MNRCCGYTYNDTHKACVVCHAPFQVIDEIRAERDDLKHKVQACEREMNKMLANAQNLNYHYAHDASKEVRRHAENLRAILEATE